MQETEDKLKNLSLEKEQLLSDIIALKKDKDILIQENVSVTSLNLSLGKENISLTGKIEVQVLLLPIFCKELESVRLQTEKMRELLLDTNNVIKDSVTNQSDYITKISLDITKAESKVNVLNESVLHAGNVLTNTSEHLASNSKNVLDVINNEVKSISQGLAPLADKISWVKDREKELMQQGMMLETREANLATREISFQGKSLEKVVIS